MSADRLFCITVTTDKQHIGELFIFEQPIRLRGALYYLDRPPKDLGGGMYRFSNSNYVVEAMEIK